MFGMNLQSFTSARAPCSAQSSALRSLYARTRDRCNVLTYAELLYTTNDMELSRKYFSLASYLDGSCLRALWGLYVCNLALKEKDRDNEKMEQLQQFTVDRLKAAY